MANEEEGLSRLTAAEEERCAELLKEVKKGGPVVKNPREIDIVAELREIAAAKHTCGKWMVRTSEENCDKIWRLIARLTREGKLGSSAKIAGKIGKFSAQDGGGQNINDGIRVICIYVSDFTNEQASVKVLRELKRQNKVVDGVYPHCDFKLDMFTNIGIYSNTHKVKGKERRGVEERCIVLS